jgi:hypothetical protein
MHPSIHPSIHSFIHSFIHLQETVVRLYRSAESLTRLTGYQLVRNEGE